MPESRASNAVDTASCARYADGANQTLRNTLGEAAGPNAHSLSKTCVLYMKTYDFSQNTCFIKKFQNVHQQSNITSINSNVQCMFINAEGERGEAKGLEFAKNECVRNENECLQPQLQSLFSNSNMFTNIQRKP
jgi:hypothetical protein